MPARGHRFNGIEAEIVLGEGDGPQELDHVLQDLDIQDDEGVNFKHAWADPKTGKVFCHSEAPNAEAVKRIHQRSGHPTDQVFEVPVQA